MRQRPKRGWRPAYGLATSWAPGAMLPMEGHAPRDARPVQPPELAGGRRVSRRMVEAAGGAMAPSAGPRPRTSGVSCSLGSSATPAARRRGSAPSMAGCLASPGCRVPRKRSQMTSVVRPARWLRGWRGAPSKTRSTDGQSRARRMADDGLPVRVRLNAAEIAVRKPVAFVAALPRSRAG